MMMEEPITATATLLSSNLRPSSAYTSALNKNNIPSSFPPPPSSSSSSSAASSPSAAAESCRLLKDNDSSRISENVAKIYSCSTSSDSSSSPGGSEAELNIRFDSSNNIASEAISVSSNHNRSNASGPQAAAGLDSTDAAASAHDDDDEDEQYNEEKAIEDVEDMEHDEANYKTMGEPGGSSSSFSSSSSASRQSSISETLCVTLDPNALEFTPSSSSCLASSASSPLDSNNLHIYPLPPPPAPPLHHNRQILPRMQPFLLNHEPIVELNYPIMVPNPSITDPNPAFHHGLHYIHPYFASLNAVSIHESYSNELALPSSVNRSLQVNSTDHVPVMHNPYSNLGPNSPCTVLLNDLGAPILPTTMPNNDTTQHLPSIHHANSNANARALASSLIASPSIFIHKQFHPYHGTMIKEHISRCLLVTGLPTQNHVITTEKLFEEMELKWGAIQTLQCEKIPEGLLWVQFYDLRAARQALIDMQRQHLLRQQEFQQQFKHHTDNHAMGRAGFVPMNGVSVRNGRGNGRDAAAAAADDGGSMPRSSSRKGLICGNVVWAQYIATWSMPKSHFGHGAGSSGHPDNQGTLVLFNVGAEVNMQELREVFEKFGDVRELREAPLKKQHKFVEFYDVRDAEAAWSALNGTEVCGRPIKIEFSRQGSRLSLGNRKHKVVQQECNVMDPILTSISSNFTHTSTSNDTIIPVVNHGDGSPLEHCGWISGLKAHPNYIGWQGYGSHYVSAQPLIEWEPTPPLLDQPPRPIMISSMSPRHAHKYMDNSPLIRQHQGTIAADLDFDPSLESHNQSNCLNVINRNPPIYNINIRRKSHNRNQLSHMNARRTCSGRGGMNWTPQTHQGNIHRRVVPVHRGGGHLVHFEYNESEVFISSMHPRTTLMVRNIPNKYSQQMLLSLLDKHCLECNMRAMDMKEPESAFDFVYLPIDFKNRCNLGYAFVNFTSAIATLRFYKAFHDQAWEEFNSRKICKVAYARVQGRLALEDHFRNSRFACDTDEYLPLVFVPPRNGMETRTPRVAKLGRTYCNTTCPSISQTETECKILVNPDSFREVHQEEEFDVDGDGDNEQGAKGNEANEHGSCNNYIGEVEMLQQP